MKIIAISDTHLRHKSGSFPEIPKCDLLIHAGDFTFEGNVKEVREAMDWFGSLQSGYKVCCAGNHDWLFQRDPTLARSLIPPGVVYLEDNMTEIEGVKIYGSPWTPEFMNWAFNLYRGYPLRQKWDKIPDGIDILVTHGPPQSFGDYLKDGESVGCADLCKAVNRIQPRIHIFGHIHNGYGRYTDGYTTYINASICDEDYRPINPPIPLFLDTNDEEVES